MALTPAGARELIERGHHVFIEQGAGTGSAFTDADCAAAGACIGASAGDVWADSDLLLKVKEPAPAEYGYLRSGLILFAFLHLAANEPLTRALVDSGVRAIAYETVETDDRWLPLLAPMSEVAGRLAVQAGCRYLEAPAGGRGLLLGGVLVPGARAPKLVTRSMVASMRQGSVICDVAVDQGGCVETTRPTTHGEPVYTVDGVTHYCVSNMPGAVPITSTHALTNATLPYVIELAEFGFDAALARDPTLARGANVVDGILTHEAVALAHGLDFAPRDLEAIRASAFAFAEAGS